VSEHTGYKYCQYQAYHHQPIGGNKAAKTSGGSKHGNNPLVVTKTDTASGDKTATFTPQELQHHNKNNQKQNQSTISDKSSCSNW